MTRFLPLAFSAFVASTSAPIATFGQDASVAPPRARALPTASREMKIVEELLSRYLEAVKAKRWADAKQLVHPKMIAVIAERKRRLGREDHPMAPWNYEKSLYYLKGYRIGDVRYASGAFVVDVLEDNYQVPEHAVAAGESAAYLVGKFRGKWYVVDKKRGETFSDLAVKAGYKDYFDKLQFPREEEEEE